MIENVKKLSHFEKYIDPLIEAAAYESLWSKKGASYKRLAELFKKNPSLKVSDLVQSDELMETRNSLLKYILESKKRFDYKTGVLVNSSIDFPKNLNDAREPLNLLYYSGNVHLTESKSLAIVGTRKPSEEGIKRTRKLVRLLVKDKFTIVSGLARGIDTVAHRTTLEEKGNTIGVIGTPLNTSYPKENSDLQSFIAKNHLLLSQVPYIRYNSQTYLGNRIFFPERNKTMSALTLGTVIVEASDTSGTLTQARAALHQKRKLFILDSCFHNKDISWPAKFEQKGAVRVKTYEDIVSNL